MDILPCVIFSREGMNEIDKMDMRGSGNHQKQKHMKILKGFL